MSAVPQPATSRKKRLIEFLKILGIPGQLLAYVIEHWGWKELAFALGGFLLGWTVVWIGASPEFLISGYRINQAELKTLPKPQSLDFNLIDPPDWLQPQVSWLEDEGEYLKKEGALEGYRVCSLNSELQDKSNLANSEFPSFHLEIQTDRACELGGFAFRQTMNNFVQPLDLAETNERSVARFVVPKGTRNAEKLVAILRLSWKQGTLPCECKNSFRLRAQ